MLDAYEAVQDPDWLRHAEAVMRFALDHFWDSKGGGFFDLESTAGPGASVLAVKRKPVEDSPSPSANGIAGLGLQRLHLHKWDDECRPCHDILVRALVEPLE